MLLKRIFQRKSEIVMFLAGLSLLGSVALVATTGDLTLWKMTKFFYAIGVVLIIFDK